MPTVVREEGFEIMVLTSPEHPPPHVHVYKAGAECRVLLGDEASPPRLWDVKGMRLKDARDALALVHRYHAQCLNVWRKYNGSL